MIKKKEDAGICLTIPTRIFKGKSASINPMVIILFDLHSAISYIKKWVESI